MKIDFAKLDRIEAAARREHIFLMDLDERWRHALAEYQRQLTALTQVGWGSQSPNPLFEWHECGRDPEKFIEKCEQYSAEWMVSAVKGMRRVLEFRTTADELKRARDDQAERWKAAHACLPPLREFAELHKRSPFATVRVPAGGVQSPPPGHQPPSSPSLADLVV